MIGALLLGLLCLFLLIIADIAAIWLGVLNLLVCVIGTSSQTVTRKDGLRLRRWLVASLPTCRVACSCHSIDDFSLPLLGMEPEARIVYSLEEEINVSERLQVYHYLNDSPQRHFNTIL